MTRTELLNALIEHYGYQSYLEIGVRDPRLNFDKIKAPQKLGCDPQPVARRAGVAEMRSDEFFATFGSGQWQLIFVDGDHSKEHAWIDMLNAVTHLAAGGTVVVHDVNPLHESWQGTKILGPSEFNKKNLWMGEAWRSWLRARQQWKSITVIVRDDKDAPSDCGIIQPWNQMLIRLPVVIDTGEISYDEFAGQSNGSLLDLASWERFKEVL